MSTDPRAQQANKLALLAWRSQTGENPTVGELAAFVLGFSLGTHFRTPVGHAMLSTRLSDHLHDAVEAMTNAIVDSNQSFETDYSDEDEVVDDSLPEFKQVADGKGLIN